MVVHEKLNQNNQQRDGGLPKHTRKEGGKREIQIPYTMESEYGGQTPTNVRENNEYTVPGLEHSWRYDIGHVLQREQDQSAVVQRQFVEGYADIGVFLKPICKMLKRDWTAEKNEEIYNRILNDWEENGSQGMIPEPDDKLAQSEEEAQQRRKEWEKQCSSIDILMNLCEHFISQEDPEKGEYKHYLMLEEDIDLPDSDEVDPNVSELLAAIDWKFLSEKEGAGHIRNAFNKGEGAGSSGKASSEEEVNLTDILWVESIVSMQSGMGSELLHDLLEEQEKVKIVALGAYGASAKRYEKIGFKCINGVTEGEKYFSGEGKACPMDSKEAYNFVIDTVMKMKQEDLFELGYDEFSISSEEHENKQEVKKKIITEINNMTQELVIDLGLRRTILYPVYIGERESIIKGIERDKEEALNRANKSPDTTS